MKFRINGLQHIGIPVSNIRKSEAFYKRLDFENVMETTFLYKDGSCTVIMMQLNDIIIELYQLPEPEVSAIRNRSDGHVDHIAFDVNNIEAVFAEMKSASFDVIEDEPVYLAFWKKGCRFFNIKGPDGERLEFNEVLK
ncbi:MAG: VOC family protein [Chitinophagaceae bacterium]|nr:VOC family protein [Chitinophagaceae bacterium]